MTITSQDLLPLQNSNDVVVARQRVRQRTNELNFTLVDQTKLITAASELARNTVIHGSGGTMMLEILSNAGKSGVRLTFEDQGVGIRDIEQALKDGYTSGSGMGIGLGGSKRLVNEFNIESEVGKGTKVTVIRWK